MKRTLFDAECRRATVARVRTLRPDSPRRWGTMDAPRMVAHLHDQMSHCLGEADCRPVSSALRLPGIKWLVIHVVPWPHGVKGPPDAFVTVPASWPEDVDRLIDQVERFATKDPRGAWPDHAKFGPMTGEEWGYFCVKHFDHHLRQFGA